MIELVSGCTCGAVVLSDEQYANHVGRTGLSGRRSSNTKICVRNKTNKETLILYAVLLFLLLWDFLLLRGIDYML